VKSDGFGSKIFDPGQFFIGRVKLAIFGLGLALKISPQKSQIYYLLPFGSKKSLRAGSKSTRIIGGSASYLLWVKSIARSGWVRAHL